MMPSMTCPYWLAMSIVGAMGLLVIYCAGLRIVPLLQMIADDIQRYWPKRPVPLLPFPEPPPKTLAPNELPAGNIKRLAGGAD